MILWIIVGIVIGLLLAPIFFGMWGWGYNMPMMHWFYPGGYYNMMGY